ncbi:MAG TPA: glycosyltransferase [Thermoanaerobaculia bacterium]|jgi:dolichol-phosphate mannosyltransferase|nr:glycosyltransferase [Thermoanaerobaculia bacterium]
MRRLAVVVAAYDERENVEPLVRRLQAALLPLEDWRWQAIFVVEGRDGTREVLERLAGELPQLQVLYHEEPSGIGAAFRRGFAAVPPDVDVVVTMDADLNHRPEELPRLLDSAARSGCDLLIGSRFVAGSAVEGTPAWKRALSWCGNAVMRHLFRLEVGDKTSGFRVYRAAALRGLSFVNDGFAFLPELLLQARAAGLVVREEPIHFVFRRRGRSKMAILGTSVSYLALLRPWRPRPRAMPEPRASGASSGAASRS